MKHEIHRIAITKLTPKESVLELAKTGCRECSHCCHFGGGFLLEEDIQRISEFFGMNKDGFENKYTQRFEKFNTTLLKLKSKNPRLVYSSCMFLDKTKGCLINQIKPLHCRISSCNEYGEMLEQWFTLNYFVNPSNPESIRQWAAYLKTHDAIQGGNLEELVPNKIMLKKILNYEILK